MQRLTLVLRHQPKTASGSSLENNRCMLNIQALHHNICGGATVYFSRLTTRGGSTPSMFALSPLHDTHTCRHSTQVATNLEPRSFLVTLPAFRTCLDKLLSLSDEVISLTMWKNTGTWRLLVPSAPCFVYNTSNRSFCTHFLQSFTAVPFNTFT